MSLILAKIPAVNLDFTNLKWPTYVHLADPHFNVPKDIGILLGSGVFYELLENDKIKLINGLVLINSKLGWIFTGEILQANKNSGMVNCQ